MKTSLRGGICLVLGGIALAFGATVWAQGSGVKALLVERCAGSCHDLAPVADRVGKTDKGGWNSLVIRMMDYGTPLSSEERERMVEYLSALTSPAALR